MNDLDALIADINKRYKVGDTEKPIISRASNLPPVKKVRCSSPVLTYLLQGGWPKGKLIEVFGKEHVGKTTVALLGMKDVWEQEEGQRSLAVVDIEHRWNEDWAKRLGLPVDDMVVVQPRTAEDATDIMKKLIESKAICGILFDSIGAAQSDVQTKDFAERQAVIGGSAVVMSRNVRVIAPLANLYDCTVWYSNQLRADMEGFNRPMTPGGHAVKHMMSVRLYLRVGKDKYYAKDAEGNEIQVGFAIVFKVVKNSYGVPFREGWSDFYFEPSAVWLDHVGFDVNRDYQRLGMSFGLIERSGPWYSYRGIKERGRDSFFAKMVEEGMLPSLIEEVHACIEAGQDRPFMTDDEPPPIPVGVDIDDADV